MQILAVLVAHAGQVVQKDDLLSLVWPYSLVEEGNLAVHVFSLRKALAEHGDGSGYIQTVPKRGYRFASAVQAAQPAPKTAAVLPNDTSALVRVAEHYLQQSTAAGGRRAAAIYQECRVHDPLNGKAHAGLANSLLMRFRLGDLGLEEGAGGAAALLAEAKKVDPGCSDVYLSLSRWHCMWDWNWQEAREDAQQALELAADDTTKLLVEAWDGAYLARMGDLDRGKHQLEHASLALTLYPHVSYYLAEAHYLARDFTRAAAVSIEALHLHSNFKYLHMIAGKALAMLGEYTEALRHLRRARLLSPAPDLGLLGAIAYVHALAGGRDRAVRLLTRILEMPQGPNASLITVATVQAALGDKHRALDNIESACARREWFIANLKRDCCLDPLRTDPRFRRVLSHVGI